MEEPTTRRTRIRANEDRDAVRGGRRWVRVLWLVTLFAFVLGGIALYRAAGWVIERANDIGDPVPAAAPFDPEAWRECRDREPMAVGLLQRHELVGRSRAEIVALLGPWDDTFLGMDRYWLMPHGDPRVRYHTPPELHLLYEDERCIEAVCCQVPGFQGPTTWSTVCAAHEDRQPRSGRSMANRGGAARLRGLHGRGPQGTRGPSGRCRPSCGLVSSRPPQMGSRWPGSPRPDGSGAPPGRSVRRSGPPRRRARGSRAVGSA